MSAVDPSLYEEIIIESSSGRTVDITQGVVMIDYYEDLFSPTITAKLQVVNMGYTITGADGELQTIYNGLPLRGGEKVILKIKPNSTSNIKLDFQFFVSSISNVIVKNKTESFTLNVISPTAISNETSRVGKKYPSSTKISDSVKDIFDNYLTSEKNIVCDLTQNVYGFIGNMRKPFTVLFWLASKSVPESSEAGSTAGYLFYETKSKFSFRSIDSLIDSSPIAVYHYNEVIQSGTGQDFKILKYNTSLNEDVLGKLQRGAYSSYRIFFDPLTLEYTDPTKGAFGLEDYASKNPKKGKSSTLGKDVVLPANLGESPSRYITAVLDRGTMEQNASKKENADPFVTQSQSMMRYNSLFSQTVRMTIPLNSNLEAGNLIECNFPLSDDNQKDVNKQDKEQSGLYMIKELCHHFDTMGSYTSLTLIKDTFGSK
tara:strand:+ start:3201 stop:4487 length:1287 start_codon:yes stop_codon:yes gene_type:complete